jgi:hypothetical protein
MVKTYIRRSPSTNLTPLFNAGGAKAPWKPSLDEPLKTNNNWEVAHLSSNKVEKFIGGQGMFLANIMRCILTVVVGLVISSQVTPRAQAHKRLTV